MPGAQTVVGVNKYRVPAEEEMAARGAEAAAAQEDRGAAQAAQALQGRARARGEVRRALDALRARPRARTENVYEKVVEAACAGVTHGEICAELRKVYGFGAAADRAVASLQFDLSPRGSDFVILGLVPRLSGLA